MCTTRFRSASGLAVGVLAAGLLAGAAEAQPVQSSPATPLDEAALRAAAARCEGGAVRRIDVRNNSLFAPEDIDEHRFEWALGFANWLHIRTRAGFVRQQLLFDEGDCWDPDLLEQSMRLLRELRFIARVEGRGEALPDSTVVVHLETWDEWSTQLGIDFDVENQFQFKGFFVRETNLLGRGLNLAFRYRSFRERDDRSLATATERFLGSRFRASVEAGSSRRGRIFRQTFHHPFLSESGRFYLDSDFLAEEQDYAFLTGDDDGVTHLLMPLRDRTYTFEWARRFGEPGALTLLGVEADVLHRDRAAGIRQVVDGRFDESTPVVDSLLVGRMLAGQPQPPSHVRLGARVGVRRLRFTTDRGLDLVSGQQDVAHGGEAYVTLGRDVWRDAFYPLGTYARFAAFVGGGGDVLAANADVFADARYLDGPPGPFAVGAGADPHEPVQASRWRDLSLVGRGLVYLRPPAVPAYLLHGGVRFDVRGNLDQPYQNSLGGETGVRAYTDQEVPVQSRVVAFVEHRLNTDWLAPAADLGLTFFTDIGRGWAGDVPFGVDTGWRKSVGGGLRIGFPAGTRAISHVEFAWPWGGPDAGRGPVFRSFFTVRQTGR